MDYLQAEAAEIMQSSQASCSGGGLLTPSSSAFTSRRDSIASSQSLASYTRSFSSPYYSPQLPATPVSQRDPLGDDFTLVDSHVSLEPRTPVDATEASFDDCLKHSALPFRNLPSAKGVNMHLGCDSDWVMVQQPNIANAMGLTQSQHSILLPAAGDFGSALQNLIGHPAAEVQLEPAAEIYPETSNWDCHQSSPPSFTGNGYRYDAYAPMQSVYQNGVQYAWSSVQSVDHFGGSLAEITQATIMPSDAILEDSSASYLNVHSDGFEGSFGSYDDCSSDGLSSPQVGYSLVKIEMNGDQTKEEIEYNSYDEKSQRMIYMKPTGGKGVRKVRRGSGVAKRKSKASKVRTGFLHLQSGELPVKIEGDIERDSNGRYHRTDSQLQKKWACHERTKDGFPCDRIFQRPEHLKRHQDTHTGRKPFYCCICQKEFGRNDNCDDHYVTHITRPCDKGRRNDRWPKAEVYQMVRANLPPEKAAKIMEKCEKNLEKERLKGKFTRN